MSSTPQLPGLPFPYNKRSRPHTDKSPSSDPVVSDDPQVSQDDTPLDTNAPHKRPRTTSTRTVTKDDPPDETPETRTPGTTLLPVARVQKIIKADKDLQAVSKEAVFLISVATEEFIKRLARAGHQQAQRDGRLTVQHKDLASAIKRAEELAFLQEIVPQAIPTATALQKRQTKKVELEQQQQLLDFQKGPQPKAKSNNAAVNQTASANTSVPPVANPNGSGEFGMFKLNGDENQGSASVSASASPTPASKAKRSKPKANGKVANGTSSLEVSREGTETTTTPSAASASAADDTMEVDS
ncbi:hypothetical protein FRC03_006203 [Tulasnella sp. 419]|nr:hypothetical protein FRC03_006203 [Tulasnella sp. 419]